PPLSESEITRERLSLEEAVRKVEAEAAQRARDAARSPGAPPRAGDALRRASARPGEAPAAGAGAAAAQRPRPATPSPLGARGTLEERADNQPRPPRNLRVDATSPPPQQASAAQQTASAHPSSPLAAQPVAMQEPPLPPGRERPAVPPRGAPQAQGVRGFR